MESVQHKRFKVTRGVPHAVRAETKERPGECFNAAAVFFFFYVFVQQNSEITNY